MGHKVTCVLLMVLMLALHTLTKENEGKAGSASWWA